MAVYKRDLVDINLENGSIHRSFLSRAIGMKDQKADHFGVRVYRNGVPVDLTGVSVQGIFLPPQGDPIAITSGNIVDGNVAEVVLPQACYNYDGQFTLSIKLVDSNNSVTGTMRIVDGMVDNTHASGTVAPTGAVPTYQEILSTYDAMVAATAAANGAIAATYSSSATYKVGDYCIHDGGLYRCTTAITTAEAWTSGHWTTAKLGPDLSNVKNAVIKSDKYINSGNFQAPYNDCDTIPYNCILCFIGVNPANGPSNSYADGSFNLMTYHYAPYSEGQQLIGGAVQIAVDAENTWMRYKPGNTSWNRWYNTNAFNVNKYLFLNSSSIYSPFDDLNTFPRNCIATYYVAGGAVPANAPDGTDPMFTIVSFNYTKASLGGTIQIVVNKDNLWVRYANGETTFQQWERIAKEFEPDKCIPALSTFDNIGLIGDSWSSGSVYTAQGTYQNISKLRWGYIAQKKYGFTPAFFTSPGATTATWLTRTEGLAAMQAADAQDAYICCLGINDHATSLTIGDTTDMDDDSKTTFYGSYGKIIRAIKAKAQYAKIAVALVPLYNGSVDVSAYNTAIRNVASHFSIGLLDTEKDGFFNSDLFRSDRQWNHLTAVGYTAMADAINTMLAKDFNVNRTYWRYSMMAI